MFSHTKALLFKKKKKDHILAKIPVLGILTLIGLAFIIIIDYGVHSMDQPTIQLETLFGFALSASVLQFQSKKQEKTQKSCHNEVQHVQLDLGNCQHFHGPPLYQQDHHSSLHPHHVLWYSYCVLYGY